MANNCVLIQTRIQSAHSTYSGGLYQLQISHCSDLFRWSLQFLYIDGD